MKAFGSRLPKCAADAFHKVAWPFVPSERGLSLQGIFESIATLTWQVHALEDEIDRLAREVYPHAQLLTQVPGLANLKALTSLLTLGDPQRFSSSRMVWPCLGLASARRQPGDREQPTCITKVGDEHLRWLLAQSANCILRRDSPD